MAALTLTTDKVTYAAGETITATLEVTGLAPGEDGWEKTASLAGSLALSTGELVTAAGEVTVAKAAVPAQTASAPTLDGGGITFTLVSFDGTTAVFRGTAA